MRALVVYCHPRPASFTAAVRDVVLAKLAARGAEVTLIDLYRDGFDPVLSAGCLEKYEDESCNRDLIRDHVEAVERCDTLIFVYPTWWYGLPAMLKGWLDRVLLPGVAFLMPKGEGEVIQPGLRHIKRLGVFTTGGASRKLTFLVGAPGRRTLMRGLGFLCARGCRKVFAMQYLMDSASEAQRRAHLDKVGRKMDHLIGKSAMAAEATA
jgi:putative NADPH-quinone reductase